MERESLNEYLKAIKLEPTKRWAFLLMKIGVLTGAGISAESGLGVFRGAGGLWEGYDIMKVASPEGWMADPEMVLDFYNMRRRKLLEATPNEGHRALAALEDYAEVRVVTQNIDDLHERAGSSSVLHLHGELLKSRSTADERLVYDIDGSDLNMGEFCELGSQLRPHIVWFGEMVPELERAAELFLDVDHLLIVGTSLEVYPAAGLIHAVSSETPITLIDPKAVRVRSSNPLEIISEKASSGVPKFVSEFRKSLIR